MDIKLKDVVYSIDITNKIENTINGMDYRTTYLVEFGSDCMATVTEVDIIEFKGLKIIERK